MAAPDLSGLGSTGLTIMGGRIYEESLRDLQGARRWKTIADMRRHPVVWSILYVTEMLCRQAGWRVDPFSDSAEDTERAAFVEECLNDMGQPLPVKLSEILTFLPYGFSLFELVYKRRSGQQRNPEIPSSKHTDGKIGWSDWSPRAQSTVDGWDFGKGGAIKGFWQIAPPSYQRVYIPLAKCLHFQSTAHKGNPEGETCLGGAFQPWYYVTNIQRVEAIGVERDLAGLPWGRIPGDVINAGGTAFDQWKEVIVNIRNDEQAGILYPSDRDEHGNLYYEFGLLSSGGQRAFNTDTIVTRYTAQIAMTMLADFILLGHEKVGSFALSSDKSELYGVALAAVLDTVCAVINDKAIPDLLRVNGMPTDNPPRLVHGDIEKVDLKTLAMFIKELTGAGIEFTDEQVGYLLEQANIPTTADGTQPRKAPPVVVAPKPDKGEPVKEGDTDEDEDAEEEAGE